jgi:diguanylate cyclase (GGDEF)-like protein
MIVRGKALCVLTVMAVLHGLFGASAAGAQAAQPSAAAPPHSGSQAPAVIEHFVAVIPPAIWMTLGGTFALAGVAGLVALRSMRRTRRQAGEFAAVAAAAHTDPLTGALNRRGFSATVERELARARRHRSPFLLAYLDVRGFKGLNDTVGHLAGDTLLKEVAALLTDSARESDVVGRIGGDEFALLLVGQPIDSADAVIDRIRARVADRRAELDLDVAWDLTIGTAAYPADGETFVELLATADRRLYEQRGIELIASHR